MYRIEHLKDNPQHLDTVAQWIYDEWWTDKPNVDLESMKTRLREASSNSQVPLSLIAFVGGHPAGTVNLVEDDSIAYPDLRPWLAALLVRKPFRNKGVGSALVQKCLECAKSLGENELFLGTDIPDYYEAFGAKVFDKTEEGLFIMKVDL